MTLDDVADVWDDGLPPGGYVCAACGQPTESEPCEEHQPIAWADMMGDPDELADDGLAERVRVILANRTGSGS